MHCDMINLLQLFNLYWYGLCLFKVYSYILDINVVMIQAIWSMQKEAQNKEPWSWSWDQRQSNLMDMLGVDIVTFFHLKIFYRPLLTLFIYNRGKLTYKQNKHTHTRVCIYIYICSRKSQKYEYIHKHLIRWFSEGNFGKL